MRWMYTPEDSHGTWEYTPGRRKSSSNPWLSGSMLIFRGVLTGTNSSGRKNTFSYLPWRWIISNPRGAVFLDVQLQDCCRIWPLHIYLSSIRIIGDDLKLATSAMRSYPNSPGASVEYLSSKGSWIPAKAQRKLGSKLRTLSFFLRGFCPLIFCFCDVLVDYFGDHPEIVTSHYFFWQEEKRIHKSQASFPCHVFSDVLPVWNAAEMHVFFWDLGLVCNVIPFLILLAPEA